MSMIADIKPKVDSILQEYSVAGFNGRTWDLEEPLLPYLEFVDILFVVIAVEEEFNIRFPISIDDEDALNDLLFPNYEGFLQRTANQIVVEGGYE